MKTKHDSGIVLVAVMCFLAITAILVLGLLMESGSQVKLAAYNVNKEQAFYVAAGGVERAVSFIANSGGDINSTNITGSIGNSNQTYGVSIKASGANPTYYTIASTGTVNGVKRAVILTGVHRQSWAKYAMFYNTGAGNIVMQTGDHFYGPVYANTFIYLSGSPGPIFEQLVSTTAGSWGDANTTAVFNGTPSPGYQFNAASQNLASISFPTLKSNAFLIVTGATSIRISSTNLYITNTNRNWSQTNYAASHPGLLSSGTGMIYVVSSGTNRGTVNVGGTNLNGRLSIVTDGDIIITNNITYANTNIPYGTNTYGTNTSDDALGLVSSNDVVVATNAPNNVNIYAHIIADCPTNSYLHGFYVQNYTGRPLSGNLNVYGGIVEFTRGAVGVPGSYGFLKNYVYDLRFATNPPPAYPVITNEFLWSGWYDKTP